MTWKRLGCHPAALHFRSLRLSAERLTLARNWRLDREDRDMPRMWPRIRRQDLVRAAYEVEGVEPVTRRNGEPCPLCEAKPDQWCKPDCIAIDLMDHR